MARGKGEAPYPIFKERVKMSLGGRIVIPFGVREAMGVKPGDEVVLSYDGRSLKVYSLGEAVRQAQELVGRHIGEGRSLSEELILERRKEQEYG